MKLSMFDLFKVGIGPSSSHTVAPMLAGKKFIDELLEQSLLHSVETIHIELYGSLAFNVEAYGTDVACIMGLMGSSPEILEPDSVFDIVEKIKKRQELALNKERFLHFNWDEAFTFHQNKTLEEHPNGVIFTAKGSHDEIVHCRCFYSIGGGHISDKDAIDSKLMTRSACYPFTTAAELLAICEKKQMTIAEIIFANELNYAKQDDPSADMEQINKKIDFIWKTMADSIERGMNKEGILPGGLEVKRKAVSLKRNIEKRAEEGKPIDNDDWVNLFAIAVSEENANGGRVVSAPTNGAAGIIAAVITYYNNFVSHNNIENIRNFLATAAAIGLLYKANASISALHLGCQGEIGVACSMAAAGLAAAKGATMTQIEYAAQMGMEHNLGLTCDPIDGLVQSPCIERNTMGAIKAIHAARFALKSGESPHMRLDTMINIMREHGFNMKGKYKGISQTRFEANLIPINEVAC